MSEQKQIQLNYFKHLCVDFSHKNSGGEWDIWNIDYNVKTGVLRCTVPALDIDASYRMPVNSDIQYVVRNLITIALTRMYEKGFDLADIRILDVYEKGKK